MIFILLTTRTLRGNQLGPRSIRIRFVSALIVVACMGSISFSNAAPTEVPIETHSPPNPHWVGFGNLLVPGLGEGLNGNWPSAAGEATYEIGAFLGGYSLSDKRGLSGLDGVRHDFAPYSVRTRGQASIEKQMYSNMLLEFAIKSHMANTFLAYRDAWAANGVHEGLDQHTGWSGLTAPFEVKSISNPWVYVPLLLLTGGLTFDYLSTSPGSEQRLNPASNFLFATHYGFIQPIASGWPEEAFYRGYVQHEAKLATGSALLAITAQAAMFALSHEQGPGQLNAFIVGTYLGYLAERFQGDLTPGVTLHFWGGLLLGLETILVSHRNQRSSPPTSFGVQFNY